MADQPMLARRQVRLAAVAALNAGALGTEVDSPGDWSTPPDGFPAILLRVPSDRKESKQMGQPEFDTTIVVEIEARVAANSASDAQDAIEAFCYRIEQLLLTDFELVKIVQRVTSVDTSTTISAEGRVHIAEAKMSFAFEVFEAFDPFDPFDPFDQSDPPPITSFGIHVDAINVADPTGTYPNAPFPSSVTPAPRTAGPDGRDEGGLEIAIPQ